MVSVCSAELTARLIEIPESGMGYQLLSFEDDPRLTHVVLNAALIVDLRERIDFNLIADVSRRSDTEADYLGTLEQFQIPGVIDKGNCGRTPGFIAHSISGLFASLRLWPFLSPARLRQIRPFTCFSLGSRSRQIRTPDAAHFLQIGACSTRQVDCNMPKGLTPQPHMMRTA